MYGFHDFGALTRDAFLKQTIRMAIRSIKKGYRENTKVTIAEGMLLLQTIVQVKLKEKILKM